MRILNLLTLFVSEYSVVHANHNSVHDSIGFPTILQHEPTVNYNYLRGDVSALSLHRLNQFAYIDNNQYPTLWGISTSS